MPIDRILWCIGYIVIAPFAGALLEGLDRVITARMQGRQGPPITQPLHDFWKLLQKEKLAVNNAQFFMVGSYTLFVILSGALLCAGGDILLSFFALTTAEMFLVMAASCTNSPFSGMGANRELIQMASYEPMILLSGVALYLAKGSFSLYEIATSWTIPAICKVPGFFIGLVFILSIKLRKSPFDLSTSHHAHQEMVKGVTTEMVGSTLAFVTIADWYEEVFLLAIMSLFFTNGSGLSIVFGYLAAFVIYLFEILVDNTCARVKWQLMFKLAWSVTFIAAGINLLILNLI